MILSRFLIQLGVLVGCLAICLPIGLVVTGPAVVRMAPFANNVTCAVAAKGIEVNGALARAFVTLNCNNVSGNVNWLNTSFTCKTYDTMSFDTLNGTFTDSSKAAERQAFLDSYRVYYNDSVCAANINSTTALKLQNCVTRAFVRAETRDVCYIHLDYQGWSIVLLLLFGVLGILAIIGMVFSLVLRPEQAENYVASK